MFKVLPFLLTVYEIELRAQFGGRYVKVKTVNSDKIILFLIENL